MERIIHRWTSEQIEMLKKLYYDTDNKVLAKMIGHSVGALTHKAFVLKIKKNKEIKKGCLKPLKHSKWSKEDLEFLTENYTTMENSEISWKLHRSILSIRAKARQLGLFKEANIQVKAKVPLSCYVEFKSAPKHIPEHIINKHKLPKELTNIRYYY